MSLLIPIATFALVLAWLRRARPDRDPRSAFLTASLVWGVLAAGITELLTIWAVLDRSPLALCWAAAAIGFALLALRALAPGASSHWRQISRPSPTTLAMILAIAAIVLVTGFTAAVAWPSQWDSMVYHLSRIDHWVQNRSVGFYPTAIVRQLFNPPWAEYAALHLIVLGESEHLANIPQWYSMVGSLLGVSRIAAHLGASARGQLFGALFCATIPMGVLQASTSQNDYVTAFWLVCLAEAILCWRVDGAPASSALRVGAALGLALLTKGSSYVLAAPLLAMLAFRGAAAPSRGRLARRIALAAAVVLVLNGPHWSRNLETFGTPLGPRSLGSATEVGDNLVNEVMGSRFFASNIVRNAALHLGTGRGRVDRLTERAITSGHEWLGVDVNDPRTTRLFPQPGFAIDGTTVRPDLTGNPIHFAVIVAAAVALGTRAAGRRPNLGAYALALVAAFLLFCLVFKWQPWHSRLHHPLFVLWSAPIGVLYDRWPRAFLAIGLLMVIRTWSPLMHNGLRPLLGEHSVLNRSRLDAYFTYPTLDRPGYEGAARHVRSKGCRQVGLMLGWDDFEHPFWVLLPEAAGRYGRIEHVDVTNSSAGLARRHPPFVPCAVVGVGRPQGDSVEIGGYPYRRSWSRGRTGVYTPAGGLTITK